MRRVRVGMCSLAVVIAAAGLTGCPPIVLTLDSATLSMVVDDTAALSVTSTKEGDTFTWRSSDDGVATVAAGATADAAVVTAVGAGEATITVTGSTGATADAVVTVITKAADFTAKFPTSLHGTRVGKETWWWGEGEEEGFSSLLAEDVDIAGCTGCHAATYADGTAVDQATYAPGCGDCHVDGDDPDIEANPVDAPTVCKGCHGRQDKEDALAASTNEVVAARFTDVHKAAGMLCFDCHTTAEVHGDGNTYTSVYASPSPECDDCHVEGGPEGATVPPSTVAEHSMHIGTIDCSACHMQTVISCYNCHIESLVDSHVKVANTALNGFVLLMNRVADGKVVPGSFQSASYQGQTMIALGGFYTHTITPEGRQCPDCHNNANIQAYDAGGGANGGTVVLGTWNTETGKIEGATGVVPIPPNYHDAVKLDFLGYDGTTWYPLEDSPEADTPDLVQIAPSLFEPLDEAQMTSLRTNMGS